MANVSYALIIKKGMPIDSNEKFKIYENKLTQIMMNFKNKSKKKDNFLISRYKKKKENLSIR
jgi:hypothetical protein